MQIVPLQDVAAQSFTATLGGQACKIELRCKDGYGTFLDLYVTDVLVVGGVVCQNLNRIVRAPYLEFEGDLCFLDQQGSEDPTTPGIGSRFQLVYLEAADVAGA